MFRTSSDGMMQNDIVLVSNRSSILPVARAARSVPPARIDQEGRMLYLRLSSRYVID
jgi:hypothetical protein